GGAQGTWKCFSNSSLDLIVGAGVRWMSRFVTVNSGTTYSESPLVGTYLAESFRAQWKLIGDRLLIQPTVLTAQKFPAFVDTFPLSFALDTEYRVSLNPWIPWIGLRYEFYLQKYTVAITDLTTGAASSAGLTHLEHTLSALLGLGF
ncbi:MAG: hypothetical protein ACXVBW_09300, partial [Bdellovibrionota bacterium]